jgi:hypothetical protein
MEPHTDLYRQLAHHLDRLPGGFPATESGVELRILRRLFSPQDAELALHLTLIPEEARVIAHRAGIPVTEAQQRLEDMASRGLCVTTCTTNALSLARKPELPAVPRTNTDANLHLGRERGVLKMRDLAAMMDKSKADRLLAARKSEGV